jgi:hypothetical protein
MPFSVQSVVVDPDLADHFSIYRSKGTFTSGGWKNETTIVPAYGVIQIASPKALQMVPEGDRVAGSLECHCAQPMYSTSEDAEGLSDQIKWDGKMFRVMSLGRWNHYGYYVAILDRMQGS